MEFMHGLKELEPKARLEKQVTHFQALDPVEEPNKRGISSPPAREKHHAVLKQGEESLTLYSCDMCAASSIMQPSYKSIGVKAICHLLTSK